MILDDFTRPHPTAANDNDWRLSTDQVMGGVSDAAMTREEIAGRTALRLRGTVSLENNGGFVQMSLDLSQDGRPLNASRFRGVALEVTGNGEDYNVHLRTDDVTRPWQSYRQTFTATPLWQPVVLPFADFQPYRLDTPLDLTRLRRIGIVAIGRHFEADLAVGKLALV